LEKAQRLARKSPINTTKQLTMNTLLNDLFKLSEKGTTFKKEMIAGLTTFAAMSYILVVNPSILSASGMPIEGLITVTALAACIGTLIMALMTNYPIAMAPGMGLNAFFAFSICLGREIPWEAALGIVFWNGILFLILSLLGVRKKIAEAIPNAFENRCAKRHRFIYSVHRFEKRRNNC
jgi:AGZA family xanthine/uracil permease-like MFS transporter